MRNSILHTPNRNPDEIWVPVSFCKDYWVSNTGRVWSFKRRHGYAGAELIPQKDKAYLKYHGGKPWPSI